MNWKVLSIGLLLACAGSESIAQDTYILNRLTPVQGATNFNIGGEGAAYRFRTAPPYSAVAVDGINWTINRTLSNGTISLRWALGYGGLESSNNAGSDFAVWSYNDAGALIDRVFTIRRANGYTGVGTGAPSSKLHVQGGNLQVFNDPNSQAYVSIGASPSIRWSLVRRPSNDTVQGYGLTIYEDNTADKPGVSGARMHFQSGGNVGIGTTLPDARLHLVHGTQHIKLGVGANTSMYTLSVGVNNDGVNITNDSQVRGYNFGNGRGRLVTIDSIGNVRIGSHGFSSHKLSVNGSAIFTKVVVKTYANWPDFVFEKDYKLRPIEDVMAFVKEHKHLPGIPSAKEVAENGQDVGDMNAKLLQKIEELTLYIAEMKKEIDALKAEKK